MDKQNEFNQGMIERFEGIRDYIVAHYKVNSRVDTPYWRDNANNDHLSRNLYEVLNAWMSGKDMQQEIAGRLKIDRFYAAVSWCCLLAGYGIYPERAQLKSLDKDYHNEREAKVDSFIARCAMNYRKHEEVIRQQTSC